MVLFPPPPIFPQWVKPDLPLGQREHSFGAQSIREKIKSVPIIGSIGAKGVDAVYDNERFREKTAPEYAPLHDTSSAFDPQNQARVDEQAEKDIGPSRTNVIPPWGKTIDIIPIGVGIIDALTEKSSDDVVDTLPVALPERGYTYKRGPLTNVGK